MFSRSLSEVLLYLSMPQDTEAQKVGNAYLWDSHGPQFLFLSYRLLPFHKVLMYFFNVFLVTFYQCYYYL